MRPRFSTPPLFAAQLAARLQWSPGASTVISCAPTVLCRNKSLKECDQGVEQKSSKRPALNGTRVERHIPMADESNPSRLQRVLVVGFLLVGDQGSVTLASAPGGCSCHRSPPDLVL